MKDIGLKLKEKREENGVSIEEVAEDLKMRPSQISSIEEGKTEDFKDIFYLKYFIRDYAKYLGLDGEEMVDEFNEFLFDFTSKIPIEEIEKVSELLMNSYPGVDVMAISGSTYNNGKVIDLSNFTGNEHQNIIQVVALFDDAEVSCGKC